MPAARPAIFPASNSLTVTERTMDRRTSLATAVALGMAAITGTDAWKQLGPDLANFASGGFTVFVSAVD
jgi:hypothetical protein